MRRRRLETNLVLNLNVSVFQGREELILREGAITWQCGVRSA